MKNLPEKELFNDLESRLRQYTEEPDDRSWDQISAVIHKDKPQDGGIWFERTADFLVIALLLFLFWGSGSTRQSLGDSVTASSEEEVVQQKLPLKAEAQLEPGTSVSGSEKNNTNIFREVTEQKARHNNGVGKSVEARISSAENVVSEQISFKSGDDDQNSIPVTNTFDQTNALTSPSGNESDGTDPDSLAIETRSADHAITSPHDSKKQEKQQRKTKHFKMYFTITPSLAYQKMTPLKNDEVVVKGIPPERIFSQNRLGISVEAGFQKQIFKRVELYAGVSYYRQDQEIGYQYQSREDVTVESTDNLNFVVTPGTAERKFEYRMRNVGASAGMFYLIKDGRLQHKAGIGIQYQKGLAKMSTENGYENSSSQYLSYQLNYRLEFMINRRASFFLQPNFTRAFYSSETLDEPFTIKPYRAGIGVGLLYTF